MDSQRRIALFIFLLVLSLGVFRLAADLGKPGHADFASFDPRSERVESIVNKHLKMTDQRIILQADKAQFESSNLPTVGDQIWPTTNEKRHRSFEPQRGGVDLSSDPREEVAIADLNRDSKDYGNYRSPHSVIQNEEYYKDRQAEEQRLFRERYAHQFIENARRNGYAVKLNSNLVVTDVRKISPAETKNPREPGLE
jgi:hypothetical protein